MSNDILKEADKLFKEMDLSEQEERESMPCHPAGVKQSPETEEMRLDFWRILLVDLVYLLSRCIMDERLLEEEKTQEVIIAQFIDTLRWLGQLPDHEGTILIRYKEHFYKGEQQRSAKKDYSVYFGNILLDRRCVQTMVKRGGAKLSYLELRLSKGFEILSHYQIKTIHVEIPRESPMDLERMRISLRIISAFHQTLTTKAPVSYIKEGEKISVSVVIDENDQPNPNLTVLAGLNNLEPEMLRGLVNKVDAWMHRPESKALGKQFTGIYSALFGIKKIQNKFLKPPIEINNVHWSLLEKVHDVLSMEKAHIARFVIDKLGESTEKAAAIMESVYGFDYGKIDAQTLGKRLFLASKLIEHMRDDWEYQSIKEEVISNLRKRLSFVKDNIIKDLIISDGALKIENMGDSADGGKIHPLLCEMLTFFKERTYTNLKVKEMVKHPVQFDDRDYENIAEKFNIPIEDAKNQVELLKSCFDDSGKFNRESFEKNIPAFARYEKSIFEFLWHYLSEMLTRKDRLDFLNAIQQLIDKLKQPKEVLVRLLEDFSRDPLEVNFSDRNALILCTLLVRKYNKEIHIDTEVTPEEVLMVWDGINKPVAQVAMKWIEAEQKLFLKKIRTIHRFLIDTLDDSISDIDAKPLKFFMALEREIYIFLSIIGGETAFSAVRIAVKEYGDPDSRIYRVKNSKSALPSLLQLLQVCMRALSRGGESEDFVLLTKISDRKERLKNLKKDDHSYTDVVERVMQWTEKACKNIERIRKRKEKL